MPRSAVTFFIRTFGCKINQYESEALREAWLARGWREADCAARAELVLANTCAVTAAAVRDLRGFVRQTARENPDARILIAGCAAEVPRLKLAELPNVAAVLPQTAKFSLTRWPEEPSELPPAAFPDFAVASSRRSRPVVKIQDGCSHGCAYCIVPRTRGPSRSRPVADILAEVRRLFAAGFREFILSGINLRHFGRDLPENAAPEGFDLWALVDHLREALPEVWAAGARLRLSSLDPAQCHERALAVIARSPMLCPHLHLSLQSLAPGVLAAMRRAHYTPEGVAVFLRRLGDIWPLFGLGADFLVGFPGETEADFAATLAAAKALPLTYAHVFPYSVRPGTIAAKLPEQIPPEVKKARAAALRAAMQAKKEAFAARVAGLPRVHVVPEGGTSRSGMSEYYVECAFTDGAAMPTAAVIAPCVPVLARGAVLAVRPEASSRGAS